MCFSGGNYGFCYQLNFGDDSSTEECFNTTMNIIIIPHTYSFGVFQAFLTINDSYTVHTRSIQISYAPLELTLESNSPVLTPPGYIVFVLNGTEKRVNNIKCLWDFGDTKSLHAHCGDLILPMTLTFQYKPTYETFKSELKTVVTCEGIGNSSTAEVVTAIEGNPILMTSLTNNGPVHPNDLVTSTLTVESHGYDACFVVTIETVKNYGNDTCSVVSLDTNTSLYGALDCPSRFNGTYSSFQAVLNETEKIEFNYTADCVGLIKVTVEAFNSYHLVELSDLVVVLEKNCRPPSLDLGTRGIRIEDPIIWKKSRDFVHRGTFVFSCDFDVRYVFTWFIKRHISNDDFVDVNHESPNSPVLFVPANALDLGTHLATLTVTMYGLHVPVNTSKHLYVHMVKSPISVSFAGGLQRNMSVTEEATIQVGPV